MGLSAPRKRTKISHDPNNTSWTRDETSYGHRILSSQGWVPGNTLGAADASHSSHYTSGSSSHVRVLLKDDNLGLGAKRGKQEDNFGLGQLQDVYGRLNGKSDVELEKEQRVRQDLGARLYVQQRFGSLPFVRGGYLVGERIETEKPQPLEAMPATKESSSAPAKPTKKLTEEPVEVPTEGVPSKKEKRKRKHTATKVSTTTTDPTSTLPETDQERRHRKEERRKAKVQRRVEKEAHKAAKEGRRAEKAERRRSRGQKKDDDVDENDGSLPRIAHVEDATAEPIATPDVLTTNPHNNRNAVRQRFIRQKRMASMDPRALREILGQKA